MHSDTRQARTLEDPLGQTRPNTQLFVREINKFAARTFPNEHPRFRQKLAYSLKKFASVRQERATDLRGRGEAPTSQGHSVIMTGPTELNILCHSPIPRTDAHLNQYG